MIHSSKINKIIPNFCSNSAVLSTPKHRIYCWIFPQKNLHRFWANHYPEKNPVRGGRKITAWRRKSLSQVERKMMTEVKVEAQQQPQQQGLAITFHKKLRGGLPRSAAPPLFVMHSAAGMGAMFSWSYLAECSEESRLEDVVAHYTSREAPWSCLPNETVCILTNTFGVGCGKLVSTSRIVPWNYSSCRGESELKLTSVACSWDGGETAGNSKRLDCNRYVSPVCNLLSRNSSVSVDVKWTGAYSISRSIDATAPPALSQFLGL